MTTMVRQCSTLKGSRGRCFGQSLRGGARVWHSRRAAGTTTSMAAGAGAGTESERVLRYPDGYERTIRYPVESTNTGPAIAERFMWPMHMHMEERRAQQPAELAGAQVMTGSTCNFQELEAEEAEEQHKKEEAEAAAAQAAAAMALQRQWEREAKQPAPTDADEADETDMPVTAAAFLRWASSEQQQEARELLLQAARDSYEVLHSSPYDADDADIPPRSLVVLSRLSADGRSAQLFTMRTRAENSVLENSLDGLLKPRTDGATGPRILVNDMRDGVLAFEDEDEAIRYAETLEAEETYGEVDTATVDAAQLFELTAGSSALVVLFRCHKMAPEPSTLLACLKGADTGMEELF